MSSDLCDDSVELTPRERKILNALRLEVRVIGWSFVVFMAATFLGIEVNSYRVESKIREATNDTGVRLYRIDEAVLDLKGENKFLRGMLEEAFTEAKYHDQLMERYLDKMNRPGDPDK